MSTHRTFRYALLSAAFACGGALSAAPMASIPKIPDYSMTPRSEVPDDYKFNLASLFPSREAWRVEFDALKEVAAKLDGASDGWTASPASMADTLDLIHGIEERAYRLYAYAMLSYDMDMGDAGATRLRGEIQTFVTDFGTQCAFTAPDILALGDDKVTAFLKAEPRLAPYRFLLETTLRKRSHTLSEAEEAIIAQLSLGADTPVKVANLLNDVDMPPSVVKLTDGSEVTLNETGFLKHRLSPVEADRRIVAEAYWTNIRKYENTFAALLDGEMRKRLALAKVYKFPSTLEASLFADDIDPAIYRNLIATVRANIAPLHRHLRLKQRMLGLPDLHYYDTSVPAAPVTRQTYSFGQASDLVMACTAPLGPDYGKHLRRAFDERWVDVYPNKGKQGGAYSLGVYGAHPFVKMNYDGRFDEVSTLAHELGHSLHSVFANQKQPYPTAGYTIFIAEIAATFNEILLVKQVLKDTTDPAVKLGILEGFLDRMRNTIYAQTMLAEFELMMHEQVAKGQSLTAEWLTRQFAALYRHYNGVDQGVVKYDESLAVSWAVIPHFYRPFYVYQYATGMVAAGALADAVMTEGEPARDRYLGLLSAGGSKFPLDLLRDAGIDMSQPEPILAALRQFDSLVAEMEAIYDSLPPEAKKGTSK